MAFILHIIMLYRIFKQLPSNYLFKRSTRVWNFNFWINSRHSLAGIAMQDSHWKIPTTKECIDRQPYTFWKSTVVWELAAVCACLLCKLSSSRSIRFYSKQNVYQLLSLYRFPHMASLFYQPFLCVCVCVCVCVSNLGEAVEHTAGFNISLWYPVLGHKKTGILFFGTCAYR